MTKKNPKKSNHKVRSPTNSLAETTYVRHMSSNHLHSQVSQHVTFCFIKSNNKTPNIQVLWLSRASRLLPGKPTSSWGHSEAAPFIQPWHFSTGEEGIASNQSQDRISTSGSAHSPLYVLCESHSTSRVPVLQPALPSCLHFLPEASAPALPSHHSWQAESTSDSQCWISSFLLLPPGTITPLQPSSQHHPQPQVQARLSHLLASPQWCAGYPALSAHKNHIKCKHWREQCSQTAGHSKPAVPQHWAQS